MFSGCLLVCESVHVRPDVSSGSVCVSISWCVFMVFVCVCECVHVS